MMLERSMMLNSLLIDLSFLKTEVSRAGVTASLISQQRSIVTVSTQFREASRFESWGSQGRPLWEREQLIETISRGLNSCLRLQQSFSTTWANSVLQGAILERAVTRVVKDCLEAKGSTRLTAVSQLPVACFDFERAYMTLAWDLITTGSVVGFSLSMNSLSTAFQKIPDLSLPTTSWCSRTENYFRGNSRVDWSSSMSFWDLQKFITSSFWGDSFWLDESVVLNNLWETACCCLEMKQELGVPRAGMVILQMMRLSMWRSSDQSDFNYCRLVICRPNSQEEARVLGRRQENNYTCLNNLPSHQILPRMVNVEGSWAANDFLVLKAGQSTAGNMKHLIV